MSEGEQNGLLAEAKRLMGEAAGEFFDGNIDRAARLADAAAHRALSIRTQNANPTREGIGELVARLYYITGALDHFVTIAEKDDERG